MEIKGKHEFERIFWGKGLYLGLWKEKNTVKGSVAIECFINCRYFSDLYLIWNIIWNIIYRIIEILGNEG